MAARILSIVLSFTTLALARLDPYEPWEEYFDHGTFLRPKNDYRLYWTMDEEAEMVEIGLQVNTTGWVGFGVSNDGTMAGADIIIGWIDTNQDAYLQRRHSISLNDRYPRFDEDISDTLLDSFQEDGVTFLHFNRELFPCADEEDPFLKQIIKGTTFVIFAFNDNEPICSGEDDECSLEAHDMQSMGSQSINFFSGESAVFDMPDDTQNFTFLMSNYTIPAEDTTYYCKFIELEPTFNSTVHMIRYDPVIQPGNEAAVHHIILYWCQDFDPEMVGQSADCNDHQNMPALGCRSDINLAGWAVGASDFYFPEHVGYPLEGKMYMLLEIHYDNPNEIEGIVDSSGIRIYWTEELREYEASQFGIAAPYSSTWVPGDIDPDVHVLQSFHSAPECTLETIPEEGVNMFVGLLHAHTIGVAMKLRHIRNNVELPPLIQNDQYDFNYQQWITFPNDVTLLPGDEFICECNYSTDRVYPTYGGQSTQNEMCVCTVYYWPSADFGGAVSRFSEEQYIEFFQTAIDNGWWNGTTSWTENEANQLTENYYYNGSHPDAFQHYVDFQKLENRGVGCSGCPDGFCADFIVPEARPDFVALPPDDFGDCGSEAFVEDEDSGLTDEEIIIIISAAGALVFVLLVCLICRYWQKRRKDGFLKSYENMEEMGRKSGDGQYGATTS